MTPQHDTRRTGRGTSWLSTVGGRGRGVWVGPLIAVVSLLLLSRAAGASAMAASTTAQWGTGVEAVLPANAAAGVQDPPLNSVSCASAGNCVAVGSYYDSSGSEQGVLLDEVSGQWSLGVEATLPSNADTVPPDPFVTLSAVSCPSVGNCVAVGDYWGDNPYGLLLDEISGHWKAGAEASGPGGSGLPGGLSGVSCPSVGSCAAVGSGDGQVYALDVDYP